MKKFLLFLLLACCIHAAANPPGENATLRGRVLDKTTGSPVSFALVSIPDLKTGTQAGIDGIFVLGNLPRGKFLVQIKALGYTPYIETIQIDSLTEREFRISSTIAEVGEVIVTGQSSATGILRTPSPIVVVTNEKLLQGSSTNLIDAIAKQPNISQLSTGSGISKPVIRGLGYNRVVVVNDGIRQEGQQWGDEHGIEIDEYSVNRVEILKGPASLAYGSDAMAGVVNMLTAPSLPDSMITASALFNYQTNNGLFGTSFNTSGNKNGFIWNLRGSAKQAHAYQNSYDGYVFNSGFRERAASAIIGFTKSWGFSHLHLGQYMIQPGISEGERDSLGNFLKPVAVNDTTVSEEIASEKDFRSYQLFYPRQDVRHSKIVLNNSFVLRNGRVNFVAGFQRNERKEFDDVLTGDYGLYFRLNTLNYDLRYVLSENNGFRFSAGVNGMQQRSQNKGSEFLVPGYSLFDIGAFAIAVKSMKKTDVSFGVRYDTRSQTADALFLDSTGAVVGSNDPSGSEKFSGFSRNFDGFSGSAGVAYNASDVLTFKFNVSRGYRAPNIAELGSNGEHEGTLRYEIGNAQLKPETSSQFDAALLLNMEHFNMEFDFFTNSIDNYIFPAKLLSNVSGDSLIDGMPVFCYVQGNAYLSGGELSFDLHPHPLDWLHFEGGAGMVRAIQPGEPDSTINLPFIPAPKISLQLRTNFDFKDDHFSGTYLFAEAEYFMAQNRIFSAYGTETATPGYTILNAGAGTDIVSGKKTLCSFYIVASNITDLAYQSHLSRLKYAPENLATGRTGIFNIGRNISFKLIIPFETKMSSKK